MGDVILGLVGIIFIIFLLCILFFLIGVIICFFALIISMITGKDNKLADLLADFFEDLIL